jgi:hypothetical protein
MKVIRKKMRKKGRKKRKMDQVYWERDGGCVEDEEQGEYH